MIGIDGFAEHAELLRAISHPTRLAVLEILRDGEQCVCHMEAILGIRQSSISQQLMILREAGLVEVRREGLNVYYRLSSPGVLGVLDAVYAASPGSRPRLLHRHGRADCPCPKCNSAPGNARSQALEARSHR